MSYYVVCLLGPFRHAISRIVFLWFDELHEIVRCPGFGQGKFEVSCAHTEWWMTRKGGNELLCSFQLKSNWDALGGGRGSKALIIECIGVQKDACELFWIFSFQNISIHENFIENDSDWRKSCEKNLGAEIWIDKTFLFLFFLLIRSFWRCGSPGFLFLWGVSTLNVFGGFSRRG